MPTSWLFVKGSESIWVERLEGRVLVVAGPGTARETSTYADEQALQQEQIALAETLSNSGWVLWASDRDRRSGRERRTSGRSSPDRRQGLR